MACSIPVSCGKSSENARRTGSIRSPSRMKVYALQLLPRSTRIVHSSRTRVVQTTLVSLALPSSRFAVSTDPSEKHEGVRGMSPRVISSAVISGGGLECRCANTNHMATPDMAITNSTQLDEDFKRAALP
jgi:hypothetical protein